MICFRKTSNELSMNEVLSIVQKTQTLSNRILLSIGIMKRAKEKRRSASFFDFNKYYNKYYFRTRRSLRATENVPFEFFYNSHLIDQ